jgi:hypothetical protein
MNSHSTIILRRLIAILLMLSGIWASAAQGSQSSLRIVIVQGNGAANTIAKNQPPLRQIAVRVDDDAGKPVSGATVFFQMPPEKDPGGTIGGQSAVSILTGVAGLANITFQPNRLAGTFRVEVSASSQGRSSSAFITETNVQSAASAGGHDKLWRFLGVGAAAVVVAALVADGSSTTTTTTGGRKY